MTASTWEAYDRDGSGDSVGSFNQSFTLGFDMTASFTVLETAVDPTNGGGFEYDYGLETIYTPRNITLSLGASDPNTISIPSVDLTGLVARGLGYDSLDLNLPRLLQGQEYVDNQGVLQDSGFTTGSLGLFESRSGSGSLDDVGDEVRQFVFETTFAASGGIPIIQSLIDGKSITQSLASSASEQAAGTHDIPYSFIDDFVRGNYRYYATDMQWSVMVAPALETVPVPGTALLLVSGLAGLAGHRRRKG